MTYVMILHGRFDCKPFDQQRSYLIISIFSSLHSYICKSSEMHLRVRFAYFIITYHFLLHVSTHLRHHHGEPSTKENTSVYPH
jgi:hypothetical protein